MATVRWALVVLMALAAVGSWAYFATATPGAARAHAQYRCPMHPAVIQSGPGSCPICGMDLVAITGGPATPGAPSEGKPASTAHGGAEGAPGTGRYWCPMHPEVTSDDPEARCAKCGGMKLLPRPGAPAEGVPGLAPVTIGPERVQRTGIRTAAARKQPLRSELRTVGFVAANESALALVTARVTGWIEELGAAQGGQRVSRGQILAKLYSPELTAAQQVLLNAVRWNEKQTSLAPVQTAAGPESDARRRLELLGVAREDVDQIARTGAGLSAVPIRSPVAGFVARRSALVGQYVQPGAELFEIADLSTVWVVADVPETDLSALQVGRKVRLLHAAYPGKELAGHVQFVYPAVNPETHTVQARIALRNHDLLLRPGMYVDVLIDLPSAEGLTIPNDAVVDTGELQYVFVALEHGRFEPRRVRLGARGDDHVRVLEGLAEGERVVTTANFLVDSESRMRAAVETFGASGAGGGAAAVPAKASPEPGAPAAGHR